MQGLDCLMMTVAQFAQSRAIFSLQQNSFQHQALKARQFISRALTGNVFGSNYLYGHKGKLF